MGSSPKLKPFVSKTAHGELSIDFSDPLAVRALNQALLKSYYGLNHWEIPPHYLCPPVPGRADYIHYVADLLAASNGSIIPTGDGIHVLDIGVGANCIYPIIGYFEYGWRLTGTDIDPVAIDSAKRITSAHRDLSRAVDLKLQKEALIPAENKFDLTLCNPPFHATMSEAQEGTRRKWKNLKVKEGPTRTALLNFGGQTHELSTPGGEAQFIGRIIEESAENKSSVFWFTSLVSKVSNLPSLSRQLRKVGSIENKVIDMAQGQKKSRFIAWTFLSKKQQQDWRLSRWK